MYGFSKWSGREQIYEKNQTDGSLRRNRLLWMAGSAQWSYHRRNTKPGDQRSDRRRDPSDRSQQNRFGRACAWQCCGIWHKMFDSRWAVCLCFESENAGGYCNCSIWTGGRWLASTLSGCDYKDIWVSHLQCVCAESHETSDIYICILSTGHRPDAERSILFDRRAWFCKLLQCQNEYVRYGPYSVWYYDRSEWRGYLYPDYGKWVPL